MAAGGANNNKGEWRPWAWKPKRRLKFWTNFCLVVAIALGIVLAEMHGGKVTNTIVWCGAALGAGSLLGFLFGIPGHSGRRIIINQPGVAAIDTGINRASGTGGVGTNTGAPQSHEAAEDTTAATPASPAANAATGTPASPAGSTAAGPAIPISDTHTGTAAPPAAGTASTDAADNDSNLVQVSDWVTKLLLGGGLTQLQQIPAKIWELSAWVAIGINPDDAVPGKEAALHANQSFAAGLLVYFALLGFFAGYFITQLQFGKKIRF